MNADLTQLIVTADHASAAAIHAPQIWQRLAAYREPYRGAACALAAAELSIDEMLGPSCADVDPEGTAVTVRRGGKTDRVGVPAGAEVYLRAQLAWCAIQGALAHEPLFAKKEEPMRSRFISYALRAPIVELGIPLLSQRAEKVRTDHARWAKRFGLSAQELR